MTPPLHPQRSLISRRLGAPLLAALLLLTACHTGPRNFKNANDELRRQNLDLQDQVKALQEKLRLQTQSLQTLQRRLAQTQPGADAQTASLIPTATELRLDRYSGLVDSDKDGQLDLLRLYVKPRDARGRFVFLIGDLDVQVVQIAAGQQPRLVTEKRFSRQEIDDAYRSTWMGTHYTLEVPLPPDWTSPPQDLTVKLFYTDAITSGELTLQQALPLPLPSTQPTH